MAKKKASRNSNVVVDDNRQTHNQNPTETEKKDTSLNRQSSMEEDHDSSAEEKVQNLKSLNALLLKQTMEKRQQIESLVQAKDEMETELARFGSEKTGLRDELGKVSDGNIELKIELDLVMSFVGNWSREMGLGLERLMLEKDDRESEIMALKREVSDVLSKVDIEKELLKKVCDERDTIKKGFELQLEETKLLKESLMLLEDKESKLEIVIERLESENDELVKEKWMRKEVTDTVNKEKIELEKVIEEKKKEIGGLKREIKVLSSAKNEMEIVKIEQRGEIEELEKKLEMTNQCVESLRKEERVLRDLVIVLKKSLDESMEKEIAVLMQIDALGKEKTNKESELERVMKEKNSVEKEMEMVTVQSSDKDKLFDQLSQEKIELEGRVFNQEAKLVELNQKVDELTHIVAVLQKDCNDRTKTNEKLSCKVGELSCALAHAEIKKEEADKTLDEEKSHGKDLKADVLKSEKLIKATLGELEKIKIEHDSLLSAKKDLECQSESWQSEKAVLEKELVELRKAKDALKTKLESAGMDAKRSMVMLKSAASMVSQDNREDKECCINGTESSSYVVELESIEKAFKNKEYIIEEMKKEAETMKQSTEEAHKKKSFWTVVSSVTTIFAAASFAYAARTR
ncbi:unnamed protein product [Cochlearia groenlandica]